MLDSAAFNDLRGYIKRRVSYARYRVGTTFYETPLNDVNILDDGTVRVQLGIHSEEAVTVNRVELYSSANELWAHQDLSITLQPGQTGILYWFDMTITERRV